MVSSQAVLTLIAVERPVECHEASQAPVGDQMLTIGTKRFAPNIGRFSRMLLSAEYRREGACEPDTNVLLDIHPQPYSPIPI